MAQNIKRFKVVALFVVFILIFSPLSFADSSEIINADRFRPEKRVEFNTPNTDPEMGNVGASTSIDFLAGQGGRPLSSPDVIASDGLAITIIPGGDITEDTTWTPANGIYILLKAMSLWFLVSH